jgi:hypothetical protein
MSTISDAEIGWLSGIADGEGCFTSKSIARVRGKCFFQFRIEATSAAMIQRVSDIYKILNIRHTLSHRFPHGGTRMAYRVEVSRKRELQQLVTVLLPHLVVKKSEAVLLLQYLETDCRNGHNVRQESVEASQILMDDLRRLKRVS